MIIIHGDNSKTSYSRLCTLLDTYKREGVQVLSFSAGEIDNTKLEQLLSPLNLFGQSSVIVVSSLFSGPKSKQKEGIKNYLKASSSNKIILYEAKEISPATIKSFPNSKIEIYKENPLIFKFVESLSPSSSSLYLYNNLLSQGVEPEYVFSMITRQIRLLITAKTNQNQLKVHPFVKQRLIAQSANFSLEHLLDLHHKLYLIDTQIKLGKTPLDMETLLTNFLVSI